MARPPDILPAGEYRWRLKLYQPVYTTSQSRQRVESDSPTLIAKMRARVTGVSGGETIRGRQVDASATHLVETKHRGDVTPEMYFLWGTRRLNVVSVLDRGGRGRELMVQCKEDV